MNQDVGQAVKDFFYYMEKFSDSIFYLFLALVIPLAVIIFLQI